MITVENKNNLYIDNAMREKNAQHITYNIKQLVFSGLRAFCFQKSFFHDGQSRTPKTQPFHIVNRCAQF